jgi:hypothetical protein
MSDFENIGDDLQYLQLQQQEAQRFDPGLIYHPAPIVVEDSRTGFDMNGDYHVVPDIAGRDNAYEERLRPYIWARWLDDAVSEYCATSDYTVGNVERGDIAEDLVNEKIEQNGLTADEGQLFLGYWRRAYGGPHEQR